MIHHDIEKGRDPHGGLFIWSLTMIMNEMIDINEKWPNFDGPINKIEGGSVGNIAIKYGITIKVGKNFCPVFRIGGKQTNRFIIDVYGK